ncbi:Pleckstrin homology domain-containing family G member 5 [Geodia barretti]|uniref:Pleckstrin homology domain-containing family G member 5 n=1 Tax=Geodia barretti TaxID=519541 RepID=A0AA35WHG1_GEOBA|nr:Pleckstrin homology domain-containing family G member 5 [Geodia barretti]
MQPGSWDDLPIKPELKKSLSQKQASQQRAIWELISTEYSHIKQLEVIINLFMQCLELVRRANVMSRDNYHNVFGGYMEELYAVHDQFWSWTLWPCLEQVYISGKPLDLSIIIQRFPEFSTDFEIYEQHCALDTVNLRHLNKAMKNRDFQTYLEWCEAHPVCQRRKLKDFLVIPMQRLTKYPLLFNAILKETMDSAHHQQLEQICSEVDSFVQSVNTALVAQTETERVRDAMSRIVTFSAVDIPGEYRELMQPYTHLDLLTPMPDVEMDQPRVLMLEGNLKFRDTSSKMVAHVFLFTDLLLITRPKKGGERFNIVRPPYQISSLVLHPLEGGSFLVLVLSQYHVMTSWFTLKATTDAVATEWMQTISHAQKCYTAAVEKKAQYCKVLQSLKTSRILNGLENRSPCQSQGSGLLSRPSLSPPRRSPTTSTESLDHAHHHKPCPILPFELRPTQPIPICRSRSADQTRYKFHSNPALTQIRLSDPLMGWPGFLSTSSQWLERTSSLKTLIERPESGFASPAVSTTQLLSPHTRSHSMDHTQFPPLPPRNSSLPQQQAPPSPDSSESEVNIQETTDAMPPDFDASSSEELLPSLTGGQQRATFGKCQSTDEDVYRPERQGKANGDEEERGIGDLVMVTPPTPSRPSPRRSATAFSSANKTPNSTASQVFTGNKPKFGLQRMMHGRKGSIDSAVARETGSAHPTKHSSLPGLASLKNAIQNRRNAHKNGKQNNSPGTSPPQKRANKSGHAHRKSRDNDSAHSALSKLGGATLTILCAVNEGEGEGREEGEGRKEEVQHSVIPTSESDTDSLSSSPRTLVVECINDITNLSEENQHDIDATNTSERQSLNLESDSTSSQLNPTKNDDREQNEAKTGETTQGGRVREREVRSGPPIILISQFSMSSSASSESELSQSSDKRRGVSPPPVLVEEESTAAVGGEPTGTDWSRGVCEEEKVGEGGSREGSTEERDGTDKSKEKALPRGTEGDEILCVEERTDATELSVSSSAFSITAKTSESRHNRTRENHSSSLSTSERNSSAVSPEAQSIAPSPLTNTLTTCSENNTSTQLSFNHDNQSLEPLSPSSLPPPSESPSATTSSLPPPTNKPTSNNPKSLPINKSHESPTTTSKPQSEATTSSPNTVRN